MELHVLGTEILAEELFGSGGGGGSEEKGLGQKGQKILNVTLLFSYAIPQYLLRVPPAVQP